ncbi:hypothetical protein HMPREF9554_02561 [Treponema phagedenis F0421]|nr:hypothetical protein HMPREF9554_02561 [Treponema phagedenis F0421]
MLLQRFLITRSYLSYLLIQSTKNFIKTKPRVLKLCKVLL